MTAGLKLNLSMNFLFICTCICDVHLSLLFCLHYKCISFALFCLYLVHRIGLERGKTARESVAAITQALEKHGQGGACSDDGHMTYHNSFIVADRSEAWVLESAAKHWAGECIKSRNTLLFLSLPVA